MANWGSDDVDIEKSRPNWKYLEQLAERQGSNLDSKVVATSKGWGFNHPWGVETLVGIGELNTNPGIRVVSGQLVSSPLINAAAQTIRVRLQLSEGVVIVGDPTLTIDLVPEDANVANITLSYSAVDSKADEGVLVFTRENVDLTGAEGNTSLLLSNASVFVGYANVVTRKTGTALPEAFPDDFELKIPIAEDETASSPSSSKSPSSSVSPSSSESPSPSVSPSEESEG